METIYDLGTKMIECTHPHTHARAHIRDTLAACACADHLAASFSGCAALDKEKVLSGDVIAIDKASGKITKLVRAQMRMRGCGCADADADADAARVWSAPVCLSVCPSAHARVAHTLSPAYDDTLCPYHLSPPGRCCFHKESR
jgi:hypothetical protein